MRVKRGVKARRRRKKVLKQAKGFRGRSKNTIRQASARVDKSLGYAYRDRRVKKRQFRRLWVTRINAALSAHGVGYSRFIHALEQSDIELDRKVLADLGTLHPEVFAEVVKASGVEAKAETQNAAS